jgi:tripartite-type tricarboxylate transporter receptor subunit TctC
MRLLTFSLAGICLPFCLAVSVVAQTPAYPDGKTIRIVVPFAAGGAQDVMARLIGTKLSTRLGTSVIIENKGGAGGIIGADSVAKAEPDGTTLLMATGGAITIAPNRPQKLPYEPKADFAPVALVADTPMTIAVRSQSPFRTLAELIAEAKARPGALTYASTGAGTVSNLTGELLAQGLGITLLHVPYRGASPAISDLISGQIDAMVTSSASIDPLVAAGQARVLASFTAGRLGNLAGAPTIAEASSLKGLEVPVWVGFLAPARTPAPVVERLAREIGAICAEADIQERFAKIGALATCGAPAALAGVIEEDLARWKTVISKGNIKLE